MEEKLTLDEETISDLTKWVEDAVLSVGGISSAAVRLVFDPPWDISMMSEEAQVALNML
jgi:metal-sulfur cluster biosynthetic enzyme